MTGAESDNQNKMMSSSAFDKLCAEQLPIALALGMSANDFWDAEPSLFWAYVKAGKIKRRQEDYAAWAQGFYINLAFADVLTQAFAGKGEKPKRIYPEKPVFTESEEDKRKKKHRKENPDAAYRAAVEQMRARFEALNDATNAAVRAKNNED